MYISHARLSTHDVPGVRESARDAKTKQNVPRLAFERSKPHEREHRRVHQRHDEGFKSPMFPALVQPLDVLWSHLLLGFGKGMLPRLRKDAEETTLYARACSVVFSVALVATTTTNVVLLLSTFSSPNRWLARQGVSHSGRDQRIINRPSVAFPRESHRSFVWCTSSFHISSFQSSNLTRSRRNSSARVRPPARIRIRSARVVSPCTRNLNGRGTMPSKLCFYDQFWPKMNAV